MDAETREELRVIHKRITDLEECNDGSLDQIHLTLESIKDSILGKLDGSDGGLLPRMRKIETDVTGLKNHNGTELTALRDLIIGLEARIAKQSKTSFSLQDIAKWKLFAILLAVIVVCITGGWPGLKWLMGVVFK